MAHEALRDIVDSPKELKEMDASELEARIFSSWEGMHGEDWLQVKAAIKIATYAHEGQVRHHDGRPYILHPLRCAARLTHYMGVTDSFVITASLLHDIPEDRPARFLERVGIEATDDEPLAAQTLRAIGAFFHPAIAAIVTGATNDLASPGMSVEERYEQYVDQKKRSIDADPRVFLVEFSDFCDNASSLYAEARSPQRDRLLGKYHPLFPAYFERLQQPDVAVYITAEGMEYALSKTQNAEQRNAALLSKLAIPEAANDSL